MYNQLWLSWLPSLLWPSWNFTLLCSAYFSVLTKSFKFLFVFQAVRRSTAFLFFLQSPSISPLSQTILNGLNQSIKRPPLLSLIPSSAFLLGLLGEKGWTEIGVEELLFFLPAGQNLATSTEQLVQGSWSFILGFLDPGNYLYSVCIRGWLLTTFLFVFAFRLLANPSCHFLRSLPPNCLQACFEHLLF